MALLVGEVAPQFTLYSDEKKPVSLSDFKGQPVVILFFPLAFTRTCTTELCSMRDELGWYQALNARILAISVDSPQTLAAFKQSQQYNFPLLSDFNKEMIRAYGTIYEEFGLGMRELQSEALLWSIKKELFAMLKCWKMPENCLTLMKSRRRSKT